MTTLTDARFDALRAQLPLVPPTTNDLLFAWAGTQGGVGNTLNDRIYTMLLAQGAPPLHVNDMWGFVLALQGFTGSLNDQLFEFWQAGGSFSGSTLDNLLLDDANLDELLIDDANPDDVLIIEGGAFFIPQNASAYSVSQDFLAGNNVIFRFDQRWKPDGTRMWFRNGGQSHPSLDSLFQYDVSPAWSQNPANWSNVVSTQIGNDADIRTMEWVNNGTRLVFLNRWFSSFRRMDSVAVSTPYDIATIGAGDGSFTGLISGEFGMKWSEDYKKVLIGRSAGTWNRYTTPIAGDLNSLVGPDQTWVGVGESMALAPGELKMYLINGNDIVSYDLASPFSISPAPSNQDTGPSMNLPTTGGVWRGLNIHPGTGELFAEGDQNTFRNRSWTT